MNQGKVNNMEGSLGPNFIYYNNGVIPGKVKNVLNYKLKGATLGKVYQNNRGFDFVYSFSNNNNGSVVSSLFQWNGPFPPNLREGSHVVLVQEGNDLLGIVIAPQ